MTASISIGFLNEKYALIYAIMANILSSPVSLNCADSFKLNSLLSAPANVWKVYCLSDIIKWNWIIQQ